MRGVQKQFFLIFFIKCEVEIECRRRRRISCPILNTHPSVTVIPERSTTHEVTHKKSDSLHYSRLGHIINIRRNFVTNDVE